MLVASFERHITVQNDLIRTALVPGHAVFSVVIRIDDRVLDRTIFSRGGKRNARAFFHPVQFSVFPDPSPIPMYHNRAGS